ncbi:transposase [Mesorhizobium sp. M0309]|uniref:transposase n=1 Tax=Mesorhizobium sp. M0309 TaxID=2956933 RepID=UPI00333C0F41
MRQSGDAPAYLGRITKQGRGHVREMLVEAAWAAVRSPGLFALSTSGSPRAAGSISRPSPLRASLQPSSGTC